MIDTLAGTVLNDADSVFFCFIYLTMDVLMSNLCLVSVALN
ncbi:MAG: hypothetical protein BSOLF_2868 [Candidatus Carbobacillus altaicus]|uniref:Uncharacterized protein n=1 Tax=Candidatus Carbonibacillus altaicus TaxID=2163959 RepID=A0A2R6Y1Q0_9BACL|nr:MAG: hypothetical protein BSOLF_2868 [Candidatus Carbobacillus altaicus]